MLGIIDRFNQGTSYLDINYRPGYIYLFGENKEWNSSDNLKIFGKVGKFREGQSAAKLPQNLKNLFLK